MTVVHTPHAHLVGAIHEETARVLVLLFLVANGFSLEHRDERKFLVSFRRYLCRPPSAKGMPFIPLALELSTTLLHPCLQLGNLTDGSLERDFFHWNLFFVSGS